MECLSRAASTFFAIPGVIGTDGAVKIARSELSAICRAVGVLQPKDSTELHDLPLVISVKCKKRRDTDEVQNEIRGYAKKEALEGKPLQAANDAPPWRRS